MQLFWWGKKSKWNNKLFLCGIDVETWISCAIFTDRRWSTSRYAGSANYSGDGQHLAPRGTGYANDHL